MAFFDIEDALQSALTTEGYNACAKPLPATFTTPHIVVDMLNAWEENAAQAIYSVDFDVRCDGYASAAQTQDQIANWIMTLPGNSIGGVPCYLVDSLRLQRAQPDAAHPTLIMATVSANLRLRLAE